MEAGEMAKLLNEVTLGKFETWDDAMKKQVVERALSLLDENKEGE